MPRVDVDVSLLFRLWNSTMRNDELCEALGISRGVLWSLRDRYKLPVRAKACRAPAGTESHQPDPTPEEIAERAAMVRRSWSASEEERRRCHGPSRYRLPAFAFDGRDTSFNAVVPMDY